MPHPKKGYKLKDGTKVPGVTTIIGRYKESGGLLRWAYSQGMAAERGEITDLYDSRDSAAEAGTLAHAMVEAHINGETIPVSDNEAAKQGFNNYLQWEHDNKIVIVAQEMQLVSELYRFGGCPDALGIDSREKLCILDWKTSTSGPFTDWLLQLGAYKILWTENNPNQPITGGFHLLKFSKEYADFSHFYWSELNEAEELFLLLRKAYDLDFKLKKRV